MFRKMSLALATAATFGAIALAPSTASATPLIWHPYPHHHHHHWYPGIGFSVVSSSCYVNRLVLTPYGYRYRTVNVCLY